MKKRATRLARGVIDIVRFDRLMLEIYCGRADHRNRTCLQCGRRHQRPTMCPNCGAEVNPRPSIFERLRKQPKGRVAVIAVRTGRRGA